MVLDTDNIERDCERLRSMGVRITRPPEHQHYGIEAQCADLDGNTIELVEPALR